MTNGGLASQFAKMSLREDDLSGRRAPKPFWPIVVFWNIAILVMFLALPFDWKMNAAQAMGAAMIVHLVVHWLRRRLA